MAERTPRLFADDFIFLEAPRWHGGELFVSDVFDHTVYALGPDGSRRKICSLPNRPSGLGFLPDGSLIVVSSKDRRLVKVEDGVVREYADLSSHAAGDVNDFAVDAQGRVYVGNFGYDYDAGEPRRTTSIHRVDPDGSIRVAATDVDFPNGSVFLNGGRTLVVAETWASRITSFDVDAEGRLSGRRVFADLGDREPDGLCADAENALWVGCFNTGEFLRVTDGGTVTDRLQFDGRGVSCTIGGADGHQLFCTVYAGSVAQLVAGERRGTVFTLPIDIPAPGIA